MKELSIEEKAKAYDKALEELRGLLEGVHEDKCEIMEEDIIKIFPELKESEDEKIRKEILDYIIKGSESDYDVQQYGKERFEKWISWIEKQGEHAKFRNSIQVGDKVTRNEDGVLVNLSQLNRVAKKDEKQGEQKPQGKSALEATNEEKVDNANKVEQKPAWSEEDEINLERAIWYVEHPAQIVIKNSMLVEWLKSLKGRVQPKQEWSEEDEYCRHQLMAFCKNCMVQDAGAKRCAHWLKSLRPQNHWKPSDEQMNTLEYYMHTLVCNEHKEILFGLYSDLKKLKG